VKLRTVALPLALGALVLTGGSSSAKVGNDIVDAKGDALAGQAAFDIEGVDVHMTTTSTTTTTVVKGKKKTVTTLKPKDLVVSMQLGATPAVQPGTSYQIGAETDCGHLFIFSYFGAGAPENSFQFSGCGGEDPASTDGEANFTIDPAVTVAGNTLTFTVPAKALPPEITIKDTFTELVAYTAVTEPVVGYATADFVPESAIDFASGDLAVLGG
jgi:hypothetical protein